MCDPWPIEPMVYEDSKCKEKGHYFVEEYLKSNYIPYTIFRYYQHLSCAGFGKIQGELAHDL